MGSFGKVKFKIMEKIKKIGVLTSGGDAPGMNAAIRAVTRAAIYNGWKVMGIYRGWEGLINNEIKDFTSESVSGTINRGGTILRTARSKEFMDEAGRAKAYEAIVKGDNLPTPGIPESLNVLLHELRGLALSVKLS